MHNREKWNSKKEFALETVNSFSDRFYLGYTATAKGDLQKKMTTLTDSARGEN